MNFNHEPARPRCSNGGRTSSDARGCDCGHTIPNPPCRVVTPASPVERARMQKDACNGHSSAALLSKASNELHQHCSRSFFDPGAWNIAGFRYSLAGTDRRLDLKHFAGGGAHLRHAGWWRDDRRHPCCAQFRCVGRLGARRLDRRRCGLSVLCCFVHRECLSIHRWQDGFADPARSDVGASDADR